MAFTASTRQVIEHLGLLDPKTLHRRRDNYVDKTNPVVPEHQVFKLGVHFTYKSPNSGAVIWDLEKTLAAWKNATFSLAMETLQEKAAAQISKEMEVQS